MPLIDRPFWEKLDELSRAMENLVDRRAPEHMTQIPGWQEFLMVAVLASRTIFKTITYITRDNGMKEDLLPQLEFGITTSPLVRSLMELLFTIVFIREKTRSRIRWFHHAGWRELKELHDNLVFRYSSIESWQPQLNNFKRNLDSMALRHKVAHAKQSDPSLISYWPTAMQMLNPKKDYLRKRTRQFLEHLTLLYRTLSQDHHISGAGVMRRYAKLLIDEKDIRREAILKDLKNRNVLISTSMLLSVYSEINDIGKFDRATALSYCWQRIAAVRDESRELYELRYRTVLQRAARYYS